MKQFILVLITLLVVTGCTSSEKLTSLTYNGYEYSMAYETEDYTAFRRIVDENESIVTHVDSYYVLEQYYDFLFLYKENIYSVIEFMELVDWSIESLIENGVILERVEMSEDIIAHEGLLYKYHSETENFGYYSLISSLSNRTILSKKYLITQDGYRYYDVQGSSMIIVYGDKIGYASDYLLYQPFWEILAEIEQSEYKLERVLNLSPIDILLDDGVYRLISKYNDIKLFQSLKERECPEIREVLIFSDEAHDYYEVICGKDYVITRGGEFSTVEGLITDLERYDVLVWMGYPLFAKELS